ncbi:protein translocase subunit secG [Cognatiyoonia koreensis]|uniref:Protein-export membrane protein SecG n=1 Tax=Cognatiyoonia koreensis TaxID=364200 RepID=A0A1I0Q6A0_9RHOB|nr:preprotein translocase subunit SecG [Cognatiyoonia koreensis]SEW22448.1 protein translocase subunit secG [Cognatiyoonia koreensis]
MENVVLVVHLILALALIGTVLMQRSEGGGLGIGGGGGGATGGRAPATAMGKFTWLLAIAFIGTSIALTIIAANNAANSSVVDGADLRAPTTEEVTTPDLGDSLLPPGTNDDESLVPSGN